MLQLDRDEAYELASRDLNSLLRLASSIRNKHKGYNITYSRKVFIPLTYLCRDVCSYCTYKKELGETKIMMLEESEALAIAEQGRKYGCTEALLVTGERPEQRYEQVKEWLNSKGFKSTPEYIAHISKLILERTGLLPHTNTGILNAREMSMLRETNPSLGSMLEDISSRLLEPNMPHEHAPSKHPKARIKMLEDAGRLKIPFTTGILIGIGESIYEAIDSLLAIIDIHNRYNHIQEVIIQNFIPKQDTLMANTKPPTLEYILRVAAIARILMTEMNIQVPPNLSKMYEAYIDAGINDWGGISPVTIDHVNPEMPWPKISELGEVTSKKGYRLKARLPVYPEFINRDMISDNLFNYIKDIIDEDGYIRSERIWI